MNPRLRARMLRDGRRLHLQDGPIDLIIEAWGETAAVHSAYVSAHTCMQNILDDLCADLPLLRGLVGGVATSSTGRRMQRAVASFATEIFITPMAAVAGAVAEEVLQVMTQSARLARAYVNNGGDIALHLAAGEHLVMGAVDRPDQPALFGSAVIEAAGEVRGIASSGWRGRSFSLGIADAVTVLATTAAVADAAATCIANDVDLADCVGVQRVPANTLDPASDLADRLVTRGVPDLSDSEKTRALEAGAITARRLIASGRIISAALHLQGQTMVVG
jgi:ApbE superfamily uncharacterized protein (UPF0280 family)